MTVFRCHASEPDTDSPMYIRLVFYAKKRVLSTLIFGIMSSCMKAISLDRILELNISPETCLGWTGDAISRKDEVILPPKISMKPDAPGCFYNSMPVIIPYLNVAGVKEVTRYPKRDPSLDSEILLYDLSTGDALALLDGNWITAMRTAAAAVHSIKLFAKDGFCEIGMIGLGNIQRAVMMFLLSLYPGRRFKIKLYRYKDQHEQFANRFSDYEDLEFVYCDSYDETVKGSEVVISCATYFAENICDDASFDEGVLVVPVHTRGFANCDRFFDRVFADDTAQVKSFSSFDEWKNYAEVADVVCGRASGRKNERERIIVYNVGISLHDIYFAKKVYDLCADKCPEIDLGSPDKKFWI